MNDKNVYDDCFYIDCTQSCELADVLARSHNSQDIKLGDTPFYPYLIKVSGDDGEQITFAAAVSTIISISPEEGVTF